MAEFIGTFLFVSVVVNVIYNNGSKDIIVNAIIIAIALIVGIMVAAPFSGGAINPAVGLALPLFQHLVYKIELTQIWMHSLGPLFGGIFAGLFQITYKYSLVEMQTGAANAGFMTGAGGTSRSFKV